MLFIRLLLSGSQTNWILNGYSTLYSGVYICTRIYNEWRGDFDAGFCCLFDIVVLSASFSAVYLFVQSLHLLIYIDAYVY